MGGATHKVVLGLGFTDVLTEGQLKRRRLGLGGSDVSAILGVNPYQTPLDVWADKTGKVPIRSVSNEAMIWGTVLEPVIASEFARRTGCELDDIPEELTPLVHESRPWHMGTPDYLIRNKRIGLEVKTAGWRMAHLWGDTGTDHIPDMYRIQCDWYSALMDYDMWEVAALIGGQDFRTYTIEKNARLRWLMLERAERFWIDHVQADVPPEPIRESDKQAVARLFAPPPEKHYSMATSAQVKLARARLAIDKELKAVKKRRDIVDAKLGIEMQLTPGIQFEEAKVRWVGSKGKISSLRFYPTDKGTT